MQGFFELLAAVAVLVWVVGPLARWQYENDQRRLAESRECGNDSASSVPNSPDPLASHPYYRPAKSRRSLI